MDTINWKCKECGHVCNHKNGIITHLRRHHGNSEGYEGRIEPTSEEITHPNQKNKNQQQTINWKCKECGHVCKSESGIKGHLINKHRIISNRENYEETSDTVTNPIMGKWKRGKSKVKRKKIKKIKCPAGGAFGEDNDELDECTDCPIWDECDSTSNNISDEKEERNKKIDKNGPLIDSDKLIVFPMIFDMNSNKVLYQGAIRIVSSKGVDTHEEDLLNITRKFKEKYNVD